MRLKNKIAIITAGASGMGRAGAIRFAEEGAKVNILDINEENGHAVAEEINKNGGEAQFFCVDLSNLPAVKAAIEEIGNKYERIDVLWNHAGIPGPSGLEEVEEADYDAAMMLNVKSGFFATKYAIPFMKKTGGSIIFTASISGLVASPLSPVYAAGKGAVVNLARALAVRYGKDNIRVNAICPGITDTPMMKQFLVRNEDDDLEKNKRLFTDNIPMGRVAQPIEIANAAVFLASDEASYINGVNLPVDGGYTAK